MVAREGRAMRQLTRLGSKLSAIVCATILAAAASASAKEGACRRYTESKRKPRAHPRLSRSWPI